MADSKLKNNKTNRIGLFCKGMAMGAADVVPGVSGGTVAFITGIYEELINSLTSFDLKAVKLLLSGNIKAVWQHVNATFLLILFGGILTSIFSLTKFINWALNTHPKLVWAYFFGLIVASVVLIGRQIKFAQWSNVAVFVLAAWLAFELTRLSSVLTTPSQLFFFVAGAIAIFAMILPGISGSFILLLLGMYQPVIEAVHDFNVLLLSTFALGCATGLLSFTHVLSWLLRRYHGATLAALTGFMLGSLNKVWPWKSSLEDTIDSNVWPSQYQLLTHSDPQIVGVVLAVCLGLLTIFVIGRASYGKPSD